MEIFVGFQNQRLYNMMMEKFDCPDSMKRRSTVRSDAEIPEVNAPVPIAELQEHHTSQSRVELQQNPARQNQATMPVIGNVSAVNQEDSTSCGNRSKISENVFLGSLPTWFTNEHNQEVITFHSSQSINTRRHMIESVPGKVGTNNPLGISISIPTQQGNISSSVENFPMKSIQNLSKGPVKGSPRKSPHPVRTTGEKINLSEMNSTKRSPKRSCEPMTTPGEVMNLSKTPSAESSPKRSHIPMRIPGGKIYLSKSPSSTSSPRRSHLPIWIPPGKKNLSEMNSTKRSPKRSCEPITTQGEVMNLSKTPSAKSSPKIYCEPVTTPRG
uniref:uncharacterized protein isoform X2 n=1 Tax=Myxine glutinosa TaxID=7769 RepID=UPI00358DEC33